MKYAYPGLLIPSIALALAPPVIADERGQAEIDEIIVTAQKREQRLLDVPMSITALSGVDLSERGIESIQDLSFAVPGLTMREDGPGSYTIFLRGLANQYGSGALVSLFLDEAPLSIGGYDQLSPVALDLQRVEVLKGPQGTLYGQGAAGGAIRYITNRPNLQQAEARVEGSLFDVADGSNGWKAIGVVSTPIVEDQLAARLAVSYEKGGGWISQPEAGIFNGNGLELLNMRGKLLWAPTDTFESELMVQVHRAETELGLGFEQPDRTVDIGPDRSKVLLPKEFDFTLYNLRMQYDFGPASLIGITTYVDHDHQYPFTYIPRPGNFSFGFVEGNDDRFLEASQFSQELRLSSNGEGPFDWTAGAYYSDGDRTLVANYEYAFAPDGDLNEGGGDLFSDLFYLAETTSQNYSLFADVAYKVNDRWTLGAGVRYFRDKQTGLVEYALGTGVRQSATFDSVDPRVYVSYHYSDESTIYASFAKGFRSGGFNSEPFGPYDPEKIHTYELGTKGMAWGGTLRYELAGFFSRYKDMVRRRLVQVDGAFLSETSNIAEVEVKGIETGVALRPVDALTLSATAAWLDSEITKTDPGDPVNVAGDPTDYVPEWSYTLSANYDFQWIAGVAGFARVDYNYRDKVTYIDRSSFVPEVLPQESDSLGLLNARIGAQWNSVGFELYGLNLSNENRWVDPYHGWANANRTRPRVLGIRVSVDF